MHDAFIRCCHQTRKLLMCAPDMLHPFQLESGLTMTYHDLPTAVFFGGAKSKGQNQYVEVVGSSSSVPLGRNGFDFRCLFELLVHLNPLQQGALRTGDSPDAYRNPSTWLCRTQVGHVAQVQTYEIPNSRPLSQKFTEASRLQQPSLPLSDPQAVQINGATTAAAG